MVEDTPTEPEISGEEKRDDLSERVQTLEQRIDRQREALARLLDADDSDDGLGPALSRRRVLAAGGITALFGLGAESASADPQGSVGTDTDPLQTLYTEQLHGGITGGQLLSDLAGSGLSIVDGSLETTASSAWTDTDADDLLEPGGSETGIEVSTVNTNTLADDGSGAVTLGNAFDLAGNDLLDDGTTVWDAVDGHLEQSALETDSLTVAGNSVALGGSTGIAHGDLSAIGAGDHHARPVAGDGLTDTESTFDVTVADFAGAFLSDDGTGNLRVDVGSGLEDDGTDAIRAALGSGLGFDGSDRIEIPAGGVGTGELNTPFADLATLFGSPVSAGANLDLGGNVLTDTAGDLSIEAAAGNGVIITTDGSNRALSLGVPTNDGTFEAGGNVVAGHPNNAVNDGSVGAVIGGGGNANYTNEVYDDYGTIGGGQFNQAGSDDSDETTAKYATVAGGDGNEASGTSAAVGGGDGNTASGERAFVGAGEANEATGASAVVGGGGYAGNNNTASGQTSFVGGGEGNTASGDTSAVGGGGYNTASGFAATIPGGYENTASGLYSFAAGLSADTNGKNGAFVWGDFSNGSVTATATDEVRFQAGGGFAIQDGSLAVEDGNIDLGANKLTNASAINGDVTGGTEITDLVGSGLSINSGALETSGGGTNKLETSGNGDTAFQVVDGTTDVSNAGSSIDSPNVVGGHPNNNTASTSPSGATIVGGGTQNNPNVASGITSIVGGGRGNEASGLESTIPGGRKNTASGDRATVAGGINNTASGTESSVGGGRKNTTTGRTSTVPGGGFGAATDDRSFVWNDGSLYHSIPGLGSDGLNSATAVDGEPVTGSNTFSVSATSGFRFITGSSSVTYIDSSGNLVSAGNVDLGGNAITNVASIDNGGSSISVDGALNLWNSDSIQDAGTDAIQFDGSQNVTIPNGDLTVPGNVEANVVRASGDVTIQYDNDTNGGEFNVRDGGGTRQLAVANDGTLEVPSGTVQNSIGALSLSTGSGDLDLNPSENIDTNGNTLTNSGGDVTLGSVLDLNGNNLTDSVGELTIQAAGGNGVTINTDGSNRALSLGVPTSDGNTFTAGGNVVVGHPSNAVNNGAVGAVIAGGGNDGSGRENTVEDHYGVVGGGEANYAGSTGNDETNATHATVSGGYSNTASGDSATVSGGNQNAAEGNYSTIVGGGGHTASGSSSTVAGGNNNISSGDYSFTAGRYAEASNDNAFVWNDGSGASDANGSPPADRFSSSTTTNLSGAPSGAETFNVKARGGVRFVTSGDNTSHAYVDTSGNVVASSNLDAQGGTVENSTGTLTLSTSSGNLTLSPSGDIDARGSATLLQNGSGTSLPGTSADGQLRLFDDTDAADPSGRLQFQANGTTFTVNADAGHTYRDEIAFADAMGQDPLGPDETRCYVSGEPFEVGDAMIQHVDQRADATGNEDYDEVHAVPMSLDTGLDQSELFAAYRERVADLEADLDARDDQIDDQHERIEDLESENDRLHAENDALRERVAAIEAHLGMDGGAAAGVADD